MTKSGTTPKQGDIVLIPVPFSDLSSSKRRPVLVLSSTRRNRRSSDIVVAAITSNPKTSDGIPIDNSKMASGTLAAASYIKPGNIYTLSKGIVIKHIGNVEKNVLDATFDRLREVFGTSVR